MPGLRASEGTLRASRRELVAEEDTLSGTACIAKLPQESPDWMERRKTAGTVKYKRPDGMNSFCHTIRGASELRACMKHRQSKAEARQILASRNIEALLKWARNRRNPLALLFSFTYDRDRTIQYRAIEASGKVAARIALEHGEEKVRDSIRRLFWIMNDESGGVGWRAPEVVAEVLLNVPSLAGEYAHLLFPLLREEPFVKSSCFAFARISSLVPELIRDNASFFAELAENPDPELRACAIKALAGAAVEPDGDLVENLSSDTTEVALYNFNTGGFERLTLKEIAGRVSAGKPPFG